ncbi:MAG: hypothetical protein ACYTGC_03065 [Planctomycetota bacterium]|jgi:hypothetical protein
MVFVVFGFVVSQHRLGLVHVDVEARGIHLLAELTLVLILFLDASRRPPRSTPAGWRP